jgi:hypothetical protein
MMPFLIWGVLTLADIIAFEKALSKHGAEAFRWWYFLPLGGFAYMWRIL